MNGETSIDKKTVLIIDPCTEGHHGTYLKCFVKYFLELNNSVIVLYPKPHEIQKYFKDNYAVANKKLKCLKINKWYNIRCPIPGFYKFLLNSQRLYFWLYSSFLTKKIKRLLNTNIDVFFPYLDFYFGHGLLFKLFSTTLKTNWSGLLFYPSQVNVLHKQSILSNKTCSSVALLDERYAAEITNNIKKPALVFPDFADSSELQTETELITDIKEKAASKNIITIIGALHKRKGFLTLLKTAEISKHENLFFVFAGALNDYDLKLYLKFKSLKQYSNCYFYLKRIPTEAQFNGIIKISDILFAAYENFPHSSNILTKAAIFKKPIIVSSGHLMADRVNRYNLGVSIQENDHIACINAIKTILSENKKRNFEEYEELHSSKRLTGLLANIFNPY